jgi:hypothetical protein
VHPGDPPDLGQEGGADALAGDQGVQGRDLAALAAHHVGEEADAVAALRGHDRAGAAQVVQLAAHQHVRAAPVLVQERLEPRALGVLERPQLDGAHAATPAT